MTFTATVVFLFKSVPGWIWQKALAWISRAWKRVLGTHLEWEIWDAPFHDERGTKSVVVFRASNLTSKELKSISFSFEFAMGDPKETLIRILPLWPLAGRLHMDQRIFDEQAIPRKPNCRVIEFDLPPQSHWRIELSMPCSLSGNSSILIFKGYEFAHKNARICRKQRH